MISCILVLYLAGPGHAGRAVGAGVVIPSAIETAIARQQTDDPDALYAEREQLASARAAEAIWAGATRPEPEGLRVRMEAGARAATGSAATRRTRNARAMFEAGIAAGRAGDRKLRRTNPKVTSGRGEHGRARRSRSACARG